MAEQHNNFKLANRAYSMFTLAEKQQALEAFARLQYPSITDRFLEAVHQVIELKQALVSNRGESLVE